MFDGYIRDHAHWTPRAPAVITPTGRRTYAEFDADIDRFGAALGDLGVTRDSGVVSVAFDNPYLTYVATAALARLCIASSPYNDHGAALRLIQREGAGAAGPGPRLVMLSAERLAAMWSAEPTPLPVLEIDPEGLGRVMLSSGTTQTPRRVPMSWRRIEACNMAILCSRGAGLHGLWISLTSIEAMQGFTVAVAGWSVGAAVGGGIFGADVPAIMEANPQGFLGCTPVQLRTILAALPRAFRAQPGWRIGAGGSRLPAAIAHEARLRLTPDVRVSYGATEATFNTWGWASDLEIDGGSWACRSAAPCWSSSTTMAEPCPTESPARSASGATGRPLATSTTPRLRRSGFVTAGSTPMTSVADWPMVGWCWRAGATTA